MTISWGMLGIEWENLFLLLRSEREDLQESLGTEWRIYINIPLG